MDLSDLVLDKRTPATNPSGIGLEAPPVWDAPFQFEMIYLIAVLYMEQRTRSTEALKGFGLTPLKMGVLFAVGQGEGITAARLARQFRVKRQSIAEVVSNLSDRALIRVQARAGARDRPYVLTDQGREMLDQTNAAILVVERAMFEGLSPEKLETLRDTLVELHHHLGVTLA